MEGEEAIMRREGDALIIEPLASIGLLELLSRLEPIDAEFANSDEGLSVLDDVAL